MFQDEELPYFDEMGNEYVRELVRQDAYVRRGGKLTAPQMIKYENRVSMLVERLVLIYEAVKSDPDAIRDYMNSIEQTGRKGALPRAVYQLFKDKLQKSQNPDVASERDRDRHRVVSGGVRQEQSTLSDLPVEELLQKYKDRAISKDTLFHQFRRRERAGLRLQRMDADLWGMYRSWLAEKRRKGRSMRKDDQ